LKMLVYIGPAVIMLTLDNAVVSPGRLGGVVGSAYVCVWERSGTRVTVVRQHVMFGRG
jgi:hypothetical protein